MADIVLSPIPYNGGTLTQTGFNFDYCYLGNGKFLNIVAQINPGFIYAFISNNANLKSGTFTSTVPTMRAVLSGTNVPTTISSIRVIKLASNRAALAVNGKIFVLEADALTDDVVAKALTSPYTIASTTTSPSTVAVAPASNAASYGTTSTAGGSYWQMFSPRDNILYVFERNYVNATGGFSVAVRKLTYNPTTDALTNNNTIATYANTVSGTGTFGFSRFYCQDIPGSTSKLLSIRVDPKTSTGAASMGGATIAAAWVVTNTDTVTALAGSFPATVQALCPMSDTTILGFASSKTYFTYTGGTWSGSAAVFAANGTASTSVPVLQVEALDSNYFILWSVANGELGQSNSIYTRIGRFVDGAFGQVSTATASGDGIGFTAWPVHFENNFIVRDGTDAFYLLGRNSTFVPQIKVIYQVGG